MARTHWKVSLLSFCEKGGALTWFAMFMSFWTMSENLVALVAPGLKKLSLSRVLACLTWLVLIREARVQPQVLLGIGDTTCLFEVSSGVWGYERAFLCSGRYWSGIVTLYSLTKFIEQL